MNALTKIENTALSAMSEQEMIEVLQSSLYPGASVGSIKMVLGYCKAAGLDPMKKPVHIVPMWDSKTKSMRDVIMPGVGNYRTDAARTGEYAGITEPEFGPDTTESLSGTTITFPLWCRVTVRRRGAGGAVAEFTAREFWKENYATAGKDTSAPNAMWKKRPYAQLAKCAEAQALRKAFPEAGSQPTADEMEGKTLNVEDDRTIDEAPRAPTTKHMGAADVVQPQGAAAGDVFSEEDFQRGLPVWQKAVNKGIAPGEVLQRAQAANPGSTFTEAQKAKILSLKKESAKDTAPSVMSFATVADAIAKANDMDSLATAGDLIRQVGDEQQRSELQTKYDEREAALKVES